MQEDWPKKDEEFFESIKDELAKELSTLKITVETLEIKTFYLSHKSIQELMGYLTTCLQKEKPEIDKKILREWRENCINILTKSNKEDIERKRLLKDLHKWEHFSTDVEKATRKNVRSSYKLELKLNKHMFYEGDASLYISIPFINKEKRETVLGRTLNKCIVKIINHSLKRIDREVVEVSYVSQADGPRFDVTYKESQVEANRREETELKTMKNRELELARKRLEQFKKNHGK